MPTKSADFYWLFCIADKAGGKTCRADRAPLGNFNRSLTTFAYGAGRRELERTHGEEK
jgi:hypothetical protein